MKHTLILTFCSLALPVLTQAGLLVETNELGNIRPTSGVVTGVRWEGSFPSGGLTTNDVCNIVTNDLGGSYTVTGTAWPTGTIMTNSFGPSVEELTYTYATNVQVRWSGSFFEMHLQGTWTYRDEGSGSTTNVVPVDAWFPCAKSDPTRPLIEQNWETLADDLHETNPISLQIHQAPGYFSQNEANDVVISPNGTTTYVISSNAYNALGLAYRRELVPSITGTVTKAYVEGLGISAGLTSNDVEGIIASSNLCPIAVTGTVQALVVTTALHTAELAAQGTTIGQWENYWTGERVRLSVTNYYGNTSGELPRLRIEESQTNVQGVVTNWITVWDEHSRHTNYQMSVDAKISTISNTLMLATWRQTNTQLADKAPKAWGTVTSAGSKAPNNTVWMTEPNTVFAGGTEYAHIAVGEGVICVLQDGGSPVYTEGEEGKFRFMDDSGTYYFGFDVTDGYTIGCRTDGISTPMQDEEGNWLIELTYDLTSSRDPIILSTTNLTLGSGWDQYPATWSEGSTAGTKLAELNLGKTLPNVRYFKAQISVASEAKFITNMQADLAGGIAASNEVLKVIQNVYPVITSTGVVWRVKN